MTLERSIAMRYLGQWRSLEVAFDGDLDAAVERFHDEHEREFSYRRDDAPVELYRLQLVATGKTAGGRAAAARRRRRHAASRPRRRDGVLRRRGASTRPSTSASDLPAGVSFEGPAVIDQLDTTTLVPPGVRAEVDEYLNIRMEVS